MEVDVTVPGLLRDCVGGTTRFRVAGGTLAGALEAMRQAYPLLRIHLYDEQGQLRQHVKIFYNSECIDWLEHLNIPLKPGDRIDVLQAVSGG
jgi:molybdopterin synthase sulfur carrier subunit